MGETFPAGSEVISTSHERGGGGGGHDAAPGLLRVRSYAGILRAKKKSMTQDNTPADSPRKRLKEELQRRERLK